MKMTKQIISCILFLAFGISAVFNILFLLNKTTVELTQIGFWVLLTVVFLVSLLGFILKNIKKAEIFPINIMTPAKEIGFLYAVILTVWLVTYSVVMIFK